MNLVVDARPDGSLMRFRVEGRWEAGDALKLTYLIKASLARARQDHILVDLRAVRAPAMGQGEFQICDRLRRALTPKARIGVVGSRELMDAGAMPPRYQCPDVAVFHDEHAAIDWLRA